MHVAAYISELIGKELPGFGAIYCCQTLDFKSPVYLGTTATIQVKVIEKLPGRKIRMITQIIDDNNSLVLDGEAIVKAGK